MADDMFISNITLTNSSRSGNFSNLCTATFTSNCSSNITSANSVTDGEYFVRGFLAYLQFGAYVLLGVIGLIGNCFVLGVVALRKDMRSVPNYFIVSLSVADLLICTVSIPIINLTRWNRVWSLGETACDFLAIINITCSSASLFNLAAIAVNRAIITRLPGKYQRLFSRPLSKIYIGFIWFLSVLYALLPAFGWGESEFDDVRFICIFSREAAPSFSFFYGICGVLLPQLICGICYLMILVTFKRSRENLEQFPDVRVSNGCSLSERKLTKNLIVVWVVFLVCWSPTAALLFIDSKGDLLGENVYSVTQWMLLFNSCVNPIIYGVFNKKFRSGYVQLIKKISLPKKCRKVRVNPVVEQPKEPGPFQVGGRSVGEEASPICSRGPLNTTVELLDVPRKVVVRGRRIMFE